MPTLNEVISAVEEFAPPGLAADWDNTGLQIGNPAASISRVLAALDPLPEVISEAKAMGAELVISHHPLFFRPITRLDLSQGQGAVVGMAAREGIAVYSAHTSLDRARPGTSDALAELIGLKKTVPLERSPGAFKGCGFGRVGKLPKAVKVSEIAFKLKKALSVETLRITGDAEKKVGVVAVCGGSGSDLMEAASASGAGLYITGDIKYHDALRAMELGMAVIDAGHFATETPAVPLLARLLKAAFKKKGWKVRVDMSHTQKEPWITV